LGAGLAGLVLLALGLWLLEAARAGRGRWPRVAQVSAGLSLAASLWLAIDQAPAAPSGSEATREARSAEQGPASTRPSGPPARPFSSERLAEARASERPVFVNMTAAWCITCLANERVALARSAVVEAFAERDLLYLKGDWTNRDARITDYLAEFGRSGVPLYVYYPPGAPPRLLPQVLTESIVLDALQP
jgi:thiol:disulfide interchange protein DsbD